MTPDLSKLSDLPALKQLARALWHNGSIRGAALMVGAGFSKYATRQAPDTQEPASWNELLDELVGQLYPIDRSSAPRDALRIAEEYRSYSGQATLDGFIRTRFPDRAWLPGPLHLQALNFPWSDILTTNWDTLLERSADEVTDFIYEIVRAEADIAHARSPRIIKLHGTLGDKEPLIFAAEDYRTYPIRHAAFVNLARQIFIENDLCLLGFSGNDPNFLEWAGWVRDHLGGHARRIYLAGYLDLYASARRYLETHNIAPIDLAPLVNHLPKNERHSAATKMFLDTLRLEQPAVSHEWKRHNTNEYPLHRVDNPHEASKDESFVAEALKETARLLRDDRESYPGWLVCPRAERGGPRFGFVWAIFRPSVLARIKPQERAETLSEFLWCYTTSFSDLPLMFRDALVVVMEANPPIERGIRLEFAVALMRDARAEGNDGNFDKWSAIVDTEADADAPERLEAQYQRCLRLRDQLDLSGLGKSLNALDTESPLWRLRQAGLYAELGQYRRQPNSSKMRPQNLRKLIVWIATLCGSSRAWPGRAGSIALRIWGYFARRGELPQAREFRHVKVDPADELEALENSADEIHRKRSGGEMQP